MEINHEARANDPFRPFTDEEREAIRAKYAQVNAEYAESIANPKQDPAKEWLWRMPEFEHFAPFRGLAVELIVSTRVSIRGSWVQCMRANGGKLIERGGGKSRWVVQVPNRLDNCAPGHDAVRQLASWMRDGRRVRVLPARKAAPK